MEGLSVSEPTPPATPIPAALENVPVLPLRDVVVYPHMVIPLFVGREKSIQALDVAMRTDKRIMLVAQKQADVDDPKGDRSEEHTSELQSPCNLVCRLLLEKKKQQSQSITLHTAR